MVSTVAVSLLGGALAALHLFAGRVRSLRVIPRSRWLSLGGGVSVAYVFVHLLPEMAALQSEVGRTVGAAEGLAGAAVEHALFIAALAGFAAFYALEASARRSRATPRADVRAGDPDRERDGGRAAGGNGTVSGDGDGAHRTDDGDGAAGGGEEVVDGAETRTSATVFWAHMASFAVYNAIVGYLLFEEAEAGPAGGVLYATAMGLHFVVNDYGLREHHEEAYNRFGRWLLAAAVLVGVAAGELLAVPTALLGGAVAFLAGGVVLNVIKEELPESRQSRFGAFGAGVAGYTLLLLLL